MLIKASEEEEDGGHGICSISSSSQSDGWTLDDDEDDDDVHSSLFFVRHSDVEVDDSEVFDEAVADAKSVNTRPKRTNIIMVGPRRR